MGEFWKNFFVFAMVTLLSCCISVSSSSHPRVTRTSDAIIIDFAGVRYAPVYHGKNDGSIPVSSLNPYSIMFPQQQQQPVVSKGWSYSYGQPSFITPVSVLSMKQNAIQCGRGPASFPTNRTLNHERIAGGTGAKKNSWPYVVAMRKSDGSLFCGGSLVSDSKVLLAAQCFEKMSMFEMSGVTVLIGMHKTDQSDVQMTRRISKIVIHSQYNAATYVNDIALVTLDSPVIISNYVAPVCLPPASSDIDQYADQDAIIMGWGSPSAVTQVLQQGKVTISSNSECKTMEFGKFVSDTNICVASTRIFTCADDVGGPVVIMSSPATWTLIGVNSYTTSDCTNVGLKTRVSAFRAWIDQYMMN